MQAKEISGGLYFTMFASSIATYAHPGHSSLPLPPESIAHYAFEPLHVLPALFAGLFLCFAGRWIIRHRWRGVVRK